MQRLEDILVSVASMVKPAEKLTVSEWAQRYRYINMPGAHVGLWSLDKTPYIKEPLDVLTSLDFRGMVFAGPARTGKSDMFWNWLGYSAHNDPADMIFYAMKDGRAAEIGKIDWKRFVNAKPPNAERSLMQQLLAPGKQNVMDKRFANGMEVMLRGPAITELSGKTVPRVWEEDYDRVNVPGPGPDDIEQQGSFFDLGSKRAETYKRFGMTGAEGSPGFEITEPNWIADSPHKAPPTKGILGLYNRGDRRRWYWMCPDCETPFEPTFSLLSYPEHGDNLERAEQAVLVCPHCGCVHTPDKKASMNREGKWLKEGETWNSDGTVTGRPRRSHIASFWMQGPAAGFQDWKGLVLNYLDAMDVFRSTGNTGPLKKTMNTDQGVPYEAPKDDHARLPEVLKARAEDWGGGRDYESREATVPPWVRFLVATVDIAVRAFVVQITGVGEYGEMTIIDSFKIRTSNRVDENDIRRPLLPIDPAGHAEDWDMLISEVIERTYPLSDGSGRRMPIKIAGSDSAGKEGFTTNAVKFWLRLRDDPEGRNHHKRFHLLKGDDPKDAMWLRETRYYDSSTNGSLAFIRGKVPFQRLNSNALKDQLNVILMREDEGGARMRYPMWLPNWAYTQLCAEQRVAGKGWVKPSGKKNESWDLSYYCLGMCQHPDIRLDFIKWDTPEKVPSWAKPWDENSMLIVPEVSHSFVKTNRETGELRKLASNWL